MADAARSAARRVEASPLVRALARGGYAASGAVHVLIGLLVLTLAFGVSGEADQSGALRAIAGAPLGLAVLWIIAVLLWALALYHLIEAFVLRGGGATEKTAALKTALTTALTTWGRRISEAGQAVVFAALGAVAASVALGARTEGNRSAEDASRGVLALPGGDIVLGLVGLGVAAGGVAFVVMGVMRSFEKKMSIPKDGVGPFVTTLGVVGYIAKGVALAIVGVLLVVAAVTSDASQAGGLDDAFDTLHGLFLGPVLVGLVGAGFVAYGLFLFFRARYARL
ncbi:DUF1206 domain-containing protein [Microbacterium paulum]|nr:DUF1206 domain-containing protein [Microbacterium sp.]